MEMNMDMMSMSHGDMLMEHENMAQDEQKKMPCKKCDKNTENIIAVLTQTALVKVVARPLHAFVSLVHHYHISLSDAVPRLIHAYTRPPPLAETLVGTVILLT